MSRVKTMSQWENLPEEILAIIGNHLDSRIDVFRFRAVSTSWRTTLSLSHLQKHPSLTLPPPSNAAAVLSPVIICRLQHLTRGTTACLVKVVETSSGELHLLSPLSHITKYVKFKTLNMLDFRLTELVRGYHLNLEGNPFGLTLKKVALFYDCGILALFGFGKLGFWGFGDENWTCLGNEGACYDDVMAYQNQFYVIDSIGIVFWIDKARNFVQYSPPLCGFGHLKHLVVSDEKFYVVDSYLEDELAGLQLEDGDRCRRRRVDIKVYKLDEEWGTWVDVKSLGDRVFVLGKEVSFSISVMDFPGYQGDCIYFIDPSDRMLEFQRVEGVIKCFGRVFRLDNGSIRMVDCISTYKRLFSPSMNWPLSVSTSQYNW